MESKSHWFRRPALAGSCIVGCAILVLFILVLPALIPSEERPRASEPPSSWGLMTPNLSACTRVEIRFVPSTLKCLFPRGTLSLLSPEETEHLRSLEKFVITDARRLDNVAAYIRMGHYMDPNLGMPGAPEFARAVCYEGDRQVATLSFRNGFVFVDGKDRYDYHHERRHLYDFMPELRPYLLRVACAGNLMSLGGSLYTIAERWGEQPDPGQWCDTVAQEKAGRSFMEYENYTRFAVCDFRCPAVKECHYALNPNCRPDSARDMVELFECEPGWNQHGGPELFTFDNHDPKGGCVLLNGGTLKFIRTVEELQQLRWE